MKGLFEKFAYEYREYNLLLSVFSGAKSLIVKNCDSTTIMLEMFKVDNLKYPYYRLIGDCNIIMNYLESLVKSRKGIKSPKEFREALKLFEAFAIMKEFLKLKEKQQGFNYDKYLCQRAIMQQAKKRGGKWI